MHKSILVGAALAVAGCSPGQQEDVAASFDVAADGAATRVTCVAASAGACQIDFRGALPVRLALKPGETRRFDDIGPGVPVCVELDPAAFANCEPTMLAAGKSTVRKRKSVRAALAGAPARA